MTEKKSIDELVEGDDFYSDMFDTLGTEDSEFGLKQVKEKIKGLLDGGYIQNFNDILTKSTWSATTSRRAPYIIAFYKTSQIIIDQLQTK